MAVRTGIVVAAGIVFGTHGRMRMNLTKIDISSLPDLDVLTGLFGSLKHFDPGLAGSNDLIIVLMVYLYDTTPIAS